MPTPPKHNAVRVWIAILIGLLFSVLIWICQPFNDFLLRNSSLADSYLPVFGIGLITVLSLMVNPLLRWKLPSLAMSGWQLTIVFSMILVAGSSTALVQAWPHALATSNVAITRDKVLADAHVQMDLPDALFPDSTEYNAPTPASSLMLEKLESGDSIPWAAWLKPAMSWGSMLTFFIFLAVGLALILYPQWRQNERLPFPLITVQQSLIETEEGRYFPDIFRSGLFWTGLVVVMVIYTFNGLNRYTGGAVPSFPLSWSLYGLFDSGDMTRHLNYYIKQGHIVFMVVGVAYFMPNRISFSIWATVLGYQVYRMFGYSFFAPFHGNSAVVDHRNGATIAVAIVVLWLGRRCWLNVARSIFKPASSDEDRRNRLAGLLFLIGCVGLFGWHLWAGNSFGYAALSIVIVVISCLVLARVVAETGLPTMGNSLVIGYLLNMLPIGWLNARAIFLTNSMDLVIDQTASRVSAVVTAMHGFGLDRDAGPKRHSRLAKGFVVLLVCGLAVTFAAHVWMGYNHSATLDGRGRAIGNHQTIELQMHNPVKSFSRGSWGDAAYNRGGHTVFGLVLALGLQIACLLSPLWPFHPVGLILMDSMFVRWAWPSIFLGWALKQLIVAYGGARVYRLARPIFLGLILGDVFSSIIWAAVPAIMLWLGFDATLISQI